MPEKRCWVCDKRATTWWMRGSHAHCSSCMQIAVHESGLFVRNGEPTGDESRECMNCGLQIWHGIIVRDVAFCQDCGVKELLCDGIVAFGVLTWKGDEQ